MNNLTCPKCNCSITLFNKDLMIYTPLTCQSCGHKFRPSFYCPDENSPACHIFVAHSIYRDNLGTIYTFCPDHSFTSYSLVIKPKSRFTAPRSIQNFINSIDTLIFRLALTLEGWRRRLFSTQ